MRMKILYLFLPILIGLSPLTATQTKVSTFSEERACGQIGFDKLKVTDIIIGMEPYERAIPQDILIDMRVTLDLQAVAETDDLESTVDYVKLAALARKEAQQGEYQFIDSLAMELVRKTFDQFPEVGKVFIRIQKPKALPNAKSGGLVELSIARDQFEHSDQIPGQIGFSDLYVYTIIGDLKEERENKQDLFVDLRVTTDLKSLSSTNSIDSTVNYVEMAQMFDQIANDGKYYMFETLAVKYLKKLHERFPQIEEAYVKIRKPGTLPSYPFKNDAITELRLTDIKKGAV